MLVSPSAKDYRLCGINLTNTSVDHAAAMIVEHAAIGRRLEVHLCNAYTLSLVDTDSILREALKEADLNLPDGSPVAWLGKGRPRVPVRGADLLRHTVETGLAVGVRHYLWGGVPGVAEAVSEKLKQTYPGIVIAGVDVPGWGVPTEDSLRPALRRMAAAGAQIIWVGLGTPKQDYAVPIIARRLGIPVVPIGAAFDFVSGRIPEAPSIFHGSGIEWLYRLSREPKRLLSRYLTGNLRFLRSAWRHRRRP